MLWVMMDEHPDSIDDAFAVVDITANDMGNVPSCLHNNGCVFGFADGHGEDHKWLNANESLAVKQQYEWWSPGYYETGPQDVAWFHSRTSALVGRP